ncbi:MAG: TlpA family protein disulfide reductase [Deltaproteobacteria bacterium]|jgi:thiol-disulfide isomerase/thioredoxin|nr:TlpA family protein disulfide reductase [Deltaproteobacteria bacterium]MBW2533488.1 TlpA family protein disulfide reductase [Deltaproteobacteria bacterium]
MNRVLKAGIVLVAVQGTLVGGYLLARECRELDTVPAAEAPETIALPLPDLVVRLADGSSRNVAEYRGRPLLLHFWATWCRPCRQELPGLLDLSENGSGQVLLVALDDDWEPVRRFLDRPVPPYVALADGSQVERRFDVRQLPESFVVDGTGTMILRFRDAQDWTRPATLELLPEELR